MIFKYYKRKNNIYFIFLTVLIIFIFSTFFNSRKNIEKPIETSNMLNDECNIVKDNRILIEHIYVCGHNEYSEKIIPREFIGESIEKLHEIYPQFSKIKYSENKLIGIINEQVKCDKHYILKLEGDLLKMFCQKYPDIPEKEFKIELIGYYENEIEILKTGLEFESKNDALEFVEDLQS